MEFASISWVLWRSTFTKAMRVATLEDNKRDIILNDIAPTLRVAEPGKVPNCEEIQQKYKAKRRKYIDSTAENIVIQTTNYQPEPSAPILTPTSLHNVEQNTERFQSLYPDVPLSVAAGGAGTSQLTTPVPPNQCVSVAGTGLQNSEIKGFVINILEDRYAEAKNDLILQLRAEVTRAEEKRNERLVAIYREAVTTNDRKNAALVAQLREEMTYNIEEKMMSLVAIKNMDSSKVASPVCERNVGPSDETGPAVEFTNVGIPIPVINDETVRITFPLFYFGEGFNVPTSVNVLQNETVEELLPVNFTKILKSYFDDILSHAAQKWEEESKKQLNSSTVTAVTVSLGLSIISCLVILAVNLTFSVIVLLIALIVMGFCWFWWCHYLRIKAKRTWEREVFKRLDSYCKQLTKASPRLFQKEITIQMIKSFDHDYYTIKSAQLYRISDQSENYIYTRVYFRVSFDIVQGNSKPDNMYEVDINQPSMLKQ